MTTPASDEPSSVDPPGDRAAAGGTASRRRWWRALGPGLITGAADDDPSGIATYSQAGAQFGYATAWTLLLTYPLMVGIQLASARIGRATGKGLTETFSRLCPRWMVRGLVALLVLANAINLGADLNAMGDSAARLAGGPQTAYAAGFGAVSLALQVFVPYARYVSVLKWLTLALFAYVGVAFSVHVDWGEALRQTVMPPLQWNREYVTTVVAILGTTISPYLFFWQADQEVEEIRRVPQDHPLRIAPEQTRAQLRRLKVDTCVGMGVSNVVAFFMIVSTAATLHAHGITHIESTAQAAKALEPVAGRFAFALFALGVIGTGLLALPVLAGSAAYAVAALLHVHKGLDRRLGAARPFYGILAAAMGLGMALGTAGIDPIRALYWAAVINAVISVPIMVAVMVAASSRRIMGHVVLRTRWKVLGWAATAAMALATAAMAGCALW
jgi:NRAMP (natural resistance-associated macrophage protein)-like metal ion transporter